MTQHRSNGDSRTTSPTFKSTANKSILSKPIKRWKSFVRKLFKPLDPLFIRIVICVFAVPIILCLGGIVYCYLLPHTYIIVAGRKDGESYILSQALKKVIENHFHNIDIEVIDTEGTDENLAVLEGDLNNDKVTKKTKDALGEAKHAHLATAQADVVADDIVKSSKSSAQKVATLYQDTFQLLVKNSQPQEFVNFMKQHSDPTKQAIIEAPLRGGQRESFNYIAQQFNLEDGKNYCFREKKKDEVKVQEDPAKPCQNKNAEDDAIFRVRILGNLDIAKNLKSGKWQLLPIEQAEAIKLKHPAFQNHVQIPQGTYQGDPPIPSKPIDTIAVQRLLLTRKDMPDWLVYEITAILNQHTQELAEALEEIATRKDPDQKKYIESYVIPLVNNIPNFNKLDQADSTGITLHPGAEKFYSPNKSWFTWLFNNIGNISSGVSVFLLIVSGLWALNLRFKKERKDKADTYIQEVALLMGFGSEDSNLQTDKAFQEYHEFKENLDRKAEEHLKNLGIQFTNLSLNIENLVKQLVKGVCSLEQLGEIFEKARKSLEREEISQGAFRTFNEAYKTAREYIERKNEDRQREISSHYVNQLMRLLNENQPHNSLDDLLKLNQIRNEAAEILTKNYIFSRESFRTFVEAHNLVRDAIERTH